MTTINISNAQSSKLELAFKLASSYQVHEAILILTDLFLNMNDSSILQLYSRTINPSNSDYINSVPAESRSSINLVLGHIYYSTVGDIKAPKRHYIYSNLCRQNNIPKCTYYFVKHLLYITNDNG